MVFTVLLSLLALGFHPTAMSGPTTQVRVHVMDTGGMPVGQPSDTGGMPVGSQSPGGGGD